MLHRVTAMSGAIAVDSHVLPLSQNPLGTYNRYLMALAAERPSFTTLISDGTPPTCRETDIKILNRLGIAPATDSFFQKLTYGPSMGFPHILASATASLRADEGSLSFISDDTFAVNQLVSRAHESTGITPESILYFIDRLPLPTMQSVHKTPALSIFNMSPHLDGNVHAIKPLFDQIINGIGYVGPAFNLVEQWLFSKPDLRNVSITVTAPSECDLAARFGAYFAEKTGTHIPNAAVVSGGGSGALHAVLISDPNKRVIIPTPFFVPQKGIAEAAEKTVILVEWPHLLEQLSRSTDHTVLITLPNNPDGSIPTRDTIRQCVDICKTHRHRIIGDLTYFNRVNADAIDTFKAVIAELAAAPSFSFIASGSKALGLTKYRVALVMGDPKTMTQFLDFKPRISTIQAVALDVGLERDNIDRMETMLERHVSLNRTLVQQIVSHTVPEPVAAQLNIGLKRLNMIATLYPPNTIHFEPGDGALYGMLRIPAELATNFGEKLLEYEVALTPGTAFYGDLSPLELGLPYESYRISLMADPFSPK